MGFGSCPSFSKASQSSGPGIRSELPTQILKLSAISMGFVATIGDASNQNSFAGSTWFR